MSADVQTSDANAMQPDAKAPSVKILIVDDDRAICDYMQTLLERDGYRRQDAERPDDHRRRGQERAATTSSSST